MLKVVNIKGLEPKDYFPIHRPTPLGNPFTVEQYGREKAIMLYEVWLRGKLLEGNPEITTALESAKKALATGKPLGCFCKPKSCHGDVIVKIIHEQNIQKMFEKKIDDSNIV